MIAVSRMNAEGADSARTDSTELAQISMLLRHINDGPTFGTLTELKTIKSTDLRHQRWVSHSRGSMLRHQTEGALIAMGLDRINIAVETDSIRSVMKILQSTDFISTMPMKTTAAYLGDDLAFLKLDHPQFHRPIGIISRNNESSSPIHNKFQQLCLQY